MGTNALGFTAIAADFLTEPEEDSGDDSISAHVVDLNRVDGLIGVNGLVLYMEE